MNNETEQIFIINSSENQPPPEVQKLSEASLSTQDIEEFSTVCRTCATVTEFVIPIFDGEGLQNNLADKIHKHLPIQVSEQDVLPRVVCYQCANTLLAWHELVQCCVQADAALRTRLAVAEKKKHVSGEIHVESNEIEVNQNKEQEEQTEFREITAYVVQSLDPPQYESPAPEPAPAPTKSCAYCLAEHPEPEYEAHLVAEHSASLFRCDECDTYVHRKDFILHMSLHAVEYASKRERRAETPRRTRRGARRRRGDTNDNGGRTPSETDEKTDEEETSEERGGAPNASPARTSDFSDPSDIDDGFGPLPESVFEAIEDSRSPATARDSPTVARSPSKIAQSPSTVARSPPPAAGDPPTLEAARASPRPADEVPREPPPAQPERRARTCAVCGKTYTAASSYFYHMKHAHAHGDSKEHACATCGKRFGTRGALAAHAAVHGAAREHACARCGKAFRARAALYIHAQTHGAPKRWACAQCGRAFRWRAQLARHAARHAPERAHACAQCERAFAVRADLLRHARTHAPAAHACAHCSAQFAQPRYLRVHMMRKHSAPAPPTSPAPEASPPPAPALEIPPPPLADGSITLQEPVS